MPDNHADLLVVGGGPAALSAATSYRDHDGIGTVMVLSDDDTLPYFRPALSKDYLRGETDEQEIALTDPARLAASDIRWRLNTSVTGLDAAQRSVTLTGGDRVHYRSCVIATGASPKPLPVPGARDPGVAYLRSARDARALRGAAEEARSAVVIGSGFIGCEAAVSLARRGVDVVVVSAEQLPQCQRLGRDAGRYLQGWLREQRVGFVGGASVKAIDNARVVRLRDRAPVAADLVVVAAGIEPRSVPIDGVPVDTRDGRLVVDEHMRSATPSLLAAGDAAYARNAAAGRHLFVEHWGEATAMGAIAGGTVAGRHDRWEHPPGFWSAIGERTLKYTAWGDGHDDTRLVAHDATAFTIWYLSGNTVVGVLTHEADRDYERGGELVRHHAPATAI